MIMTRDHVKRDQEVDLLWNCTPEEIYLINGCELRPLATRGSTDIAKTDAWTLDRHEYQMTYPGRRDDRGMLWGDTIRQSAAGPVVEDSEQVADSDDVVGILIRGTVLLLVALAAPVLDDGEQVGDIHLEVRIDITRLMDVAVWSHEAEFVFTNRTVGEYGGQRQADLLTSRSVEHLHADRIALVGSKRSDQGAWCEGGSGRASDMDFLDGAAADCRESEIDLVVHAVVMMEAAVGTEVVEIHAWLGSRLGDDEVADHGLVLSDQVVLVVDEDTVGHIATGRWNTREAIDVGVGSRMVQMESVSTGPCACHIGIYTTTCVVTTYLTDSERVARYPCTILAFVLEKTCTVCGKALEARLGTFGQKHGATWRESNVGHG